MASNESVDRIEHLFTALLALIIADREERSEDTPHRKTEVVLADAGLGLSDIAALTGRKYESVKSTLRRSKSRESMS
jgi:DNA-directed RNA polymerase specialized sigma24 family protein